MKRELNLISVVVPCYNEASNIRDFFGQLHKVLANLNINYEIVYVNDGSADSTLIELQHLAEKYKFIKIINLSRNFGKEIATTAGIHYAKGDALILIDGDGQHPAEPIPKLVKKWQAGTMIVVGVRSENQKEGLIKHLGSKIFYSLFNKFTGSHLVPGSTDFRLIDRSVQSEFIKLTERNRITRGLIDWLGFERDYVTFKANPRLSGEASYSISKLFKLALNSFVSLSLTPLYIALYLGLFVLPLSILLGLFSVIEMLIGDPFKLHIKGTAYLVILLVFLVGIVLISQGIMAVYLSHIHTETQNRPLFVIDQKNSHGINT